MSVPAQQADIFCDGFEAGNTSRWTGPVRVAATGQVTCYGENGTVIACAGTGQDGDVRSGASWPAPRFVDNGDGTVTDMLTQLVWLQDASFDKDPDAFGDVFGVWPVRGDDGAGCPDGAE